MRLRHRNVIIPPGVKDSACTLLGWLTEETAELSERIEVDGANFEFLIGDQTGILWLIGAGLRVCLLCR